MPMPNPDQQMVDNATSAIASKNASMFSKKKTPVAKNNGRMDAIQRRLNMKKGK